MAPRKYSEEYIKSVINKYKNGLSSVKIASENNVSIGSITYILKHYADNIIRSNKQNSRKYFCNEHYFDNIDTREKAYWLGFIYADGYISHNTNQKIIGLSLAIKDIEHMKKFNKAIDSTYPIKIYNATGYSIGKYCRINITSDQMFDSLLYSGVKEHKTNILEPPTKNCLSQKFYGDFIRGYVDGDGCITYVNKQHTDFKVSILGTIPILDFIKEYIEDNNIGTINRYYQRHPNDTVHNLDVCGRKRVKKFLDLLYNNATVYLERKYNRYIELRQLCGTVEPSGNTGC